MTMDEEYKIHKEQYMDFDLTRWYPVRVRFGDAWHEDEIEGMSVTDALKNAVLNWEDADEIIVIDDQGDEHFYIR
ncbi:MAG TPA: hypothetical protein VFF14_01460 [Candidatus Deferrimicrobium sp.]|nr:hypothetical protein [Candidatus Deferrimicrobium sp.]